MPPGRFDLWKRHQNWCHSTKARFCLNFLAPKRSQLPVSFHTWRQNGANFLRNLLSPPYRNLWASKTTLILRFFEKIFERRLCRQRETVLRSSFYPLTATWRAKKRHGFSKYLSTKLPKPAPLKKRHCFFAFLLRWSSVADSGVIFSALSSTPVPQHPKQKSKHCIETFSSTT